MRRYIMIVIACILLFGTLNGCGLFKEKAINEIESDELAPVSSILLSEEEAKKLNEKLPVHLYFCNKEETKLIKEIRYIPISEAKKSTGALASYIVKELCSGPTSTRLMKATIPEGAELRAPVKIEGRVAIVDMNQAFVDNHAGGKQQEEMTIYSITNSLTELKDIEKVKFLINGKVEKEFKGNFKFDSEFPRNEALIDKEACESTVQGMSPEEQSSSVYEEDEEAQETVEILE